MSITIRPEERVLVVGAGPIGIACGISAKRRGFDPLIVDAGALVNSILHYPDDMVFFTTPELLEIGGHPLTCSGQKPSRSEALKYYRGVARNEELRVSTFTRLTDASREPDHIRCRLESLGETVEVRAERLILATGYYDHPNRLGVPGEDLPHVSHYFDEPHSSYDRDVVVIGGKNSAAEAALELFRAGARVTLVYRGTTFPPSVKYWVRPDLLNRIAAGEIDAHFESHVSRIAEDHVVVADRDGEETTVAARRVYALIGYHPDHDLFRRMGIELQGEDLRPAHDPQTLQTNVPGIFMAGSITGGRKISEIFIENGRFDGEKIFGDSSRETETGGNEG